MSVTAARVEPSIAGVGDYIELMKPRVMSLVVFTALVGLLLAPGHVHPVIGLWSVRLREELRHALVQEDIRRIDRWTARYRLATVTWPTNPVDPFFNANTVEDIAEADRLAALDGD